MVCDPPLRLLAPTTATEEGVKNLSILADANFIIFEIVYERQIDLD
jgi:hypothetical protein